MSWQTPPTPELWRAIKTYLRHAYDGPISPAGVPASVPSAVRARLEVLRATDPTDLFDSNIFERDTPAAPRRYSLRLGNRSYPHMKLVVDRAPDGRGYLFSADSHDNHVRPRPGSRDEQAFLALMRENHKTADAIESAWEAEGVPTFKKYLRDDLERRRSAAAASVPVAPPPAPPPPAPAPPMQKRGQR